jgi:hypothetical protein
MKKTKNLGTWYGEIQSSRGHIIVIRDQQLPSANKGRIYLYNTDRDEVIEYDEAIVTPKLVELSEEDAQEAKAKHTTATNRKTQSSLELLPTGDDKTSDDDDG